MKHKTVPVDNDFEFMILTSLRYAIGRRTYACSLVANYIKSIWDKLSLNCKILLKENLEREVDDADRGLKAGIYKEDPLGDKCNRETWKNLRDWMK
jgi:hypothetical protein